MASLNGNIRITLKKPIKSGADGVPITTYESIPGVWARIPRYWGKKREEERTELAERTTVFEVKRTQRLADINTDWKIEYREKGSTIVQELDITSVSVVSSQRAMLKDIQLYAQRKDVT